MSLTGKTKASSYKDLLIVPNSNNGIDSTTRNIASGEGTASALNLSDDVVLVTPKSDDTTAVFKATDKDSNALLTVDSSNDLVKAGIGQHTVNTNIKEFAMDSVEENPAAADTWYGLVSTFNQSTSNELAMGTGSTPATTLTIANTASIAIRHYWYVPANITIQAVHCLAGADAAGGDTFKFSVMSYTVDTGNGSTGGDLSSGVENCASPSTISGAGREQIYYQSLTINNADVDAGKVILVCVAQDGTTADLSLNMQILYNLR